MKQLEELFQLLDNFEFGDLLGASKIQTLIEKIIIGDETDFDQSAGLSKFLDDWLNWIKNGSSESSEQVLDDFRHRMDDIFGRIPPVSGNPNFKKNEPNPKPEENPSLFIADMEVFQSFLSETQEHLESIEGKILGLEHDQDPKLIHEIFRAFHTIKGVSSFLNLDGIKSVTHSVEFLLDDMRNGVISISRDVIDLVLEAKDWLSDQINLLASAAAQLKTEKGSAELPLILSVKKDLIERVETYRKNEASRNQIKLGPQELFSQEMLIKFHQEKNDILDQVENIILIFEKSPNTLEGIHEAFRLIHTLKGNSGFFGLSDLENLCMEMEYFLDRLRKKEIEPNENSINTLLSFLDSLKQKSIPIPASKNEVKIVPKETTLNPEEKDSTTKNPDTESIAKYTIKKKDIRVDTEKLDALFDLMGELITAQAMVIDNPDLKNLQLENFKKASTYLAKITRELQNVTMAIRMIPLEGLFSKMNRLVRDLAKKFDKPVELHISGQETEMDRNIIEEISDPLVHIIRNAIDHGLEHRENRLKAGKPELGTIGLNARYEGNEIWISIKDDGNGLNRDKILEKAIERGLVQAKDKDALSDQDIWRMIFEPGFSTASVVSEISGRGVGMDVVKKNIEKLRGQVAVQTELGKGTEFILKIPLTLAIIDVVLLKSGDTLYSLPIADVAEFQNVNSGKQIQMDNQHKVMRLRDEVMPVVRLSDVFNVATSGILEREVALILNIQGKKLSLIVDEIVGYRQIVLKALPEYMGHMDCISGCTILGNGEVSLIIDVQSLYSKVLR